MRSFFYNLDRMMLESQDDNKMLYDFCVEVKNFIMKGTFTGYKKVDTVLAYWGHQDSFVSEMTGMKEGTVRQARRNMSNELYELFGYDFFEVVSAGDSKAIKEGSYRLYLAEKGYKSDNFLYRELITQIKAGEESDEAIDVSTCASEIQFLVRHSKQSIEREMSMLDINKLSYLVKMLDNEVDTPLNIRYLIKCFEKEISHV